MTFREFIKSYNEIFKAFNKIYHVFALDCGLSDSASIILYELRFAGSGITQKDIGSWLSLSKQTVNTSIKRLESQGLVICRDGEGDRRMRYVELTDEGREFCRIHIDRIIKAEANTFARMTDGQAEELLSAEKRYYEIFLQESIKIRKEERENEQDTVI